MPTTIATGQITITDYNDAVSLISYINTNLGSTTQQYDPNGNIYTPNWKTQNVVLTPSLYKLGDATDLINSSKVTDTKWFQVSGGTETQIADNAIFTVLTTGYRTLTIKDNDLSSVPAKDYIFECTYTDDAVGGTGLAIKIRASITLTKTVNGGGLVCALMTTPEGTVFKNTNVTSLKLHCDLWRGSVKDTTGVNYEWYQMDGSVVTDQGGGAGWRKLTNTAASYEITNNDMTVYSKNVSSYAVFKCVCIDTEVNSPTNGLKFADIATLVDQTDPIGITIFSTAGNALKNGTGSSQLTAKLYRVGLPLDEDGSMYNYTWSRYNKDGTKVNFNDGNSTKSGKTITVTGDDIDIKSTFTVEISNKG